MNPENQINFENKKPEFHFKEIASLEPEMAYLLIQLKEKIDKGEYDTLISDDAGGRIPTLVIREIIKSIYPDDKLNTFFVASGMNYHPKNSEDYKQLQEYIEKIKDNTKKKILIITQFIFSGGTLIRLAKALKQSEIYNFDMATVYAMPHFRNEDDLRRELGDNNLYVGGEEWNLFHEEHEKFGGVGKSKTYSPIPKKITDVISKEGRDISLEEWNEIFEIEKNDSPWVRIEKSQNPVNNTEFERRTQLPLTEEEKKEIQKNIKFAREDVQTLAKNIVSNIWVKK